MKLQTLQVLEEGNHLSILAKSLSFHCALYSSCLDSSCQLASAIAFANLWLLIMPFTFKSSIITTWFSLTIEWVNLWILFVLTFLTFSWTTATFFLCLNRLPEPFFFFESCRCSYVSFFAYFLVILRFLKALPSEQIARSLIPRSMPICLSVRGNASCSVSHVIDAKNLSVGVLDIVAKRIFPVISRWSLIFIPSLNFGRDNLPSLISIDCGHLKESTDLCFDLNLGNMPCFLKNLPYAVSRSFNDACNDCELISFNHSNS